MLVDLAKLVRACALLALALALGMANLPAFAQEDPLADKIFEALRPKSLPRNFDTSTLPPSASVPNLGSQGPDIDIDRYRNRDPRSFDPEEREALLKYPQGTNIEINFEYRSASITPAAMPNARSLGKALTRAELKGSTFLIAGHTDARGGVEFNQRLSERRAGAVKRFLVAEYNIPARDLIAVGYGKSKPKNPSDPYGAENRRVWVANISASVANK
jgi:outer membrane protein OmpA-like peptidoglycan-associated protein